MKRQLLTPTEAGVILGVSAGTINSLCRSEHIAAEKVGTMWRIFKSDFYSQFKIPRNWKPQDGARFMGVVQA
ncbi:MAG: helix-turn-helix domain-containing protein, partial [Oscillospiraceae bacterium]|nr:helix-turn-helix domain-containing protein [Oscillospiraceae bacterium]